MKNLILIFMITLGVASCASSPPTPLTVTEEVRKSSQTDDNLFRAITGETGNFGALLFLDGSLFPDARHREIVKIEVLPVKDDNQEARFERWHIQHDQGEINCYLVKLPIDGRAQFYNSVTSDSNCRSTSF